MRTVQELLVPCPHACVNLLRVEATTWPDGRVTLEFKGHQNTHNEWNGQPLVESREL